MLIEILRHTKLIKLKYSSRGPPKIDMTYLFVSILNVLKKILLIPKQKDDECESNLIHIV